MDISPLFKKILRLPDRSYKTLAKKNKPEEQRPWATINIIEPTKEEKENLKIPIITKLIWETEEKAIIDFKSTWRIQIKLDKIPPHKLI